MPSHPPTSSDLAAVSLTVSLLSLPRLPFPPADLAMSTPFGAQVPSPTTTKLFNGPDQDRLDRLAVREICEGWPCHRDARNWHAVCFLESPCFLRRRDELTRDGPTVPLDVHGRRSGQAPSPSLASSRRTSLTF